MLWTAFILGLLGSFHCVGMCGPIALMLPVDLQNPWRKAVQISLYHVGRISTYALIGLVFGLIGESFALFGFQQQLSIIIGVIMLSSLLFSESVLGKLNLSKPVFKWVGKLKSELGSSLKKKELDTFFYLGLLNGLLPCGLVYMAVFGSIAIPGLLESSLYMVFFGLGTVPLMSIVIYAKAWLNSVLKFNPRKLIPIAIAIIGVLFILRGLGLGIPYVSPQSAQTEVTSSMECH
ncbi:sulfite exporter TauE/SafE family protein [Psychroflexus sp. YR1-1]|uniref:Sulfite exporter TauE/SafE family protein n=1 Tax=Psychroflexus aurantiacus TaxID=2709310 RepID=A0A6B3R0V7_9FLAO|nr:sulfite exporter TauE/SafE family protein [Psychroflexus aurantiacus]NEV93628.1 sulfite exporter TauE/SafE family protein [Psychroflexus aurantiacus]